jgi:REP element-mobilizing transposase RayT
MQLNALGQMVNAYWQRLPSHFPHLTLDAFVIMPNHIHGILVLTDSRRGAALDEDLTNLTENDVPNATPNPNDMPHAEPGVAFGRNLVGTTTDHLPNAAPLQMHGMVGAERPNSSEPNDSGRGAALDEDLTDLTENDVPNATPNPNDMPHPTHGEPSEPGVVFGQEMVQPTKNPSPNAALLRALLVAGAVGAIVLNFKSVTNRTRNRMQRSSADKMWQRNYYEHIIRNAESLQHLRQYIHNNPRSWQEDQLHPNVPSKW